MSKDAVLFWRQHTVYFEKNLYRGVHCWKGSLILESCRVFFLLCKPIHIKSITFIIAVIDTMLHAKVNVLTGGYFYFVIVIINIGVLIS